MPQQTLNPVSEYGKSGSIFLVNPTERRNQVRYLKTAAELRSPAVIRGTPPPYVAPVASVLTTVSPATGPVAGGTAVTLTGTGFGEAYGATFGGAPASLFLVNNSTTITCVSPAGTAGAKDVVVLDPEGNGTKASGFTYT